MSRGAPVRRRARWPGASPHPISPHPAPITAGMDGGGGGGELTALPPRKKKGEQKQLLQQAEEEEEEEEEPIVLQDTLISACSATARVGGSVGVVSDASLICPVTAGKGLVLLQE